LQSDKGLVKVEKSSRHMRSLLIIGILVLSFSLSFTLRALPLEYGFELHEFDPFFNYRATQFVIENGLPTYLLWNDDLSWHPHGRDVPATSQVMLHISAAVSYQIFGLGSNLYDFTILFPAVISSLTAIVIFALVRTIGGTTAGLLASLFFAISPIIIIRGTIGWFKSEPLGLFYGLLAVYLLLSAIKSDKGKVSVAKIVGAGILLAFGIASWGGTQFFILPIGLFFVALPFLRKDNKFIIWTSIIFTSVFLVATISFDLITSMLERDPVGTGLAIISSLNGLFLIGCTAFLVIYVVIKNIIKKQLRSGLVLLGGAIIAGIVILSSNIVHLPAFRYLNAANPFLITTDVLVDSVSEHATTTIDTSFYFFSVLMIFAGIGAWFLFQKKVNRSLNIKYEMAGFALIIGFLGIYFSSAFVRLEIFGSISIIILSSIGLSILISKILKGGHKPTSVVTKISFLAIIVALLVVPMAYPERINWSIQSAGAPYTIVNSGTHFDISTNDWSDSMKWLKENTPEDAVIASWWDYGYWISALAERKTLADNSTLIDWQIRKIAAMFFSTPDSAWQILTNDANTNVASYYVSLPDTIWTSSDDSGNLIDMTDPSKNVLELLEERKLDSFKQWNIPKTLSEQNKFCHPKETRASGESPGCQVYDPEIAKKYPTLFDYWVSEVYEYSPVLTGLDADYIVINLAAEKLPAENITELYTLEQQGGDETKAFWFIKIADLPIMDYYNSDLMSYTDKFWNETLLGKLIPFTLIAYVDPNNTELQSMTFKPGYVAIYVKDVKFSANGDDPFELVYLPPSFQADASGPLTGPLIYKINKEYNPNQ